MKKIDKYIQIITIGIMIFLCATTVRAAGLQNYNLGSSGAIDYEVGEAVWNGNVFQVQTRFGGTGVLRPVQITTGSNVGIYIKTDGNVGIGTTAPDYKLHVKGTADSVVKIETSGGIGSFAAVETKGGGTNADWFFGTNRADMAGTVDNFFIYKNAGTTGTKLVIQDNGNVGIGTTNPSAKLSLGSDGISQKLLIYESGNTRYGMGIGTSALRLFSASDGAISFGKIATSDGGTYSENMRIDNTGNVGIGTTSPTGGKLHVYQGSDSGWSGRGVFSGLTNATIIGTYNGVAVVGAHTAALSAWADLYINEDGTGRGMTVKSSGNVGIGTSTPAYKLDVWGTGSFTQPVIVGTPTGATHATTKSYVDSVVTGGGGAGAFTTLTSSATTTLASSGGSFSVGTNKLFVDGVSGSVGIGITGAAIAASGEIPRLFIRNASNAGGIIELSAGTNTDNDQSGTIQFANGNNANTVNSSAAAYTGIAQIRSLIETTNANAGQDSGAHLTFSTKAEAGVLAERLRITSSGNVGIGTTNPGQKLEVNSGAGGTSLIQVYAGSNANNAQVGFLSGYGAILRSTSNAMYLSSSGSTYVGSNIDSPAVTVLSGGNVGIGTTGPTRLLSISAGTSPYLSFNTGATEKWVIGRDGSGFIIYDTVAAAYRMVIAETTGNVGIGTTGPAVKLHLSANGDTNAIRLSSTVNRPGGFQITDADDNESVRIFLDPNSGAGYLKFQSGAGVDPTVLATHMVINSNTGNVGIGTSTPSYKLDVVGTSQFSQPVIVGTPTANSHSATKSYVDSMLTGSGQWTTNGGLVYLTSTTQNVGIGTTGPGAKLDVTGGNIRLTTAQSKLVFDSPYRWIQGTRSDGDYLTIAQNIYAPGIQLGFDDTVGGAFQPKVTILANGNVGIGTTGPVAKLQSSGAAQVGAPTLGNMNGVGLYITNTDVQYGLVAGVSPSGDAWLQVMRSSGATAYNLNLQPSGGNVSFPGSGVWNSTGNVGIATSTPSYALTVNGYGWFNQPVIVGTPTNAAHAATKSYVDSIVGGGAGAGSFSTLTVSGTSTLSGNLWLTGAMYSNLNMNGRNIQAVGKLTVTTIDPLYEIEGAKYSTYAPSIAGGVKEEYVGRGNLQQTTNNEQQYQYTIDFSKIERGSDLWVWYKSIDFSKDNVEVLATAYGVPVAIAYEIEGKKIIFNAISNEILRFTQNDGKGSKNDGIEFSYRLVGKRFDWREHPTYAKDQSEPAGLIVK